MTSNVNFYVKKVKIIKKRYRFATSPTKNMGFDSYSKKKKLELEKFLK